MAFTKQLKDLIRYSKIYWVPYGEYSVPYIVDKFENLIKSPKHDLFDNTHKAFTMTSTERSIHRGA
jgi:hypothetical protein